MPPVRRLWASVLCGYLAFGATLQALPTYVAERFGAGPTAAGLAVGIAFAATAVCRPFAGRAGDAGHSRPVVLLGGLLIAAGAIGQLLAPDLAILLIARLVMGAGEAALFSAALPWVLADTPLQRRGRVAGWFGLSMWGGLAAGPLVAVAAHHVGGTGAVWAAVLALGVASALLVATTRPQAPHADRPSLRPANWRHIVPAGSLLPGLGFGLSAYGYGAITALLVLYLTHSGIGGQNAGLAVFAAAFLAARWLGSPTVDRYGGAPIAFAVLVTEAAGLTLLAAIPTLTAALAGTALTGIGVSLMFPATVAMTLRRTGPLRAGTSVGAMTSFWDLGILAAAPTSGILATHLGYRAGFATAAIAALGALTVALTLYRHPDTRQTSRRAPTAVRST